MFLASKLLFWVRTCNHFRASACCPTTLVLYTSPSTLQAQGMQTGRQETVWVCQGGGLHVIRSLYCRLHPARRSELAPAELFYFSSFLRQPHFRPATLSSPLLLHIHNTQRSTTNRKESILLQPWSSCQTSEEEPRQTGPPSSNSLRRTRCEKCLNRPSAMLSP